jgi:NAD(P)-dependent dehydrogenase (short-subunit alcohol dehydrogenase family)
MQEPRFSGKVGIVTGAGRGVGRQVALDLAAEGCRVALVDIRAENLEAVAAEVAGHGGEAMPVACDISRSDQVNAMVARVVERFGTVDLLVNNAGILQMKQPLENITDSEWQRMMDVNLNGAFYCLRAVLPIMKAKNYGRIVNVSSSAGRSTSANGGAHYTVSKAAILGLSRHAARECARYNIRINAVAPASLNTDMAVEAVGLEHLEASRSQIPVGRLGTPEDISPAILFLLSDAVGFLTGATLDINGGLLMI